MSAQFLGLMSVFVRTTADNVAPKNRDKTESPTQNQQEAVRQLEQAMDHITDDKLVQKAKKAWETKTLDVLS